MRQLTLPSAEMTAHANDANKRLLPHVRDHTGRAHHGKVRTTKWPEGLRIPSEPKVRVGTITLAPRAKEETKEEGKEREHPVELIHVGLVARPRHTWSSFCCRRPPKPSAPSVRGRGRYGGGGRTADV